LPRNRIWTSSEFPNLFDLSLFEPVARSFFSSDCNNLRGVIRKLGVHVRLLAREPWHNTGLTVMHADTQHLIQAEIAGSRAKR
jgi:hypothetical protein